MYYVFVTYDGMNSVVILCIFGTDDMYIVYMLKLICDTIWYALFHFKRTVDITYNINTPHHKCVHNEILRIMIHFYDVKIKRINKKDSTIPVM